MKGSMTQFNRSTNMYHELNDPLYSDGERCFIWNPFSGRKYLSLYEREMRRANDILKYGKCRVRVRAKSERI